jgi:hypothetical protein
MEGEFLFPLVALDTVEVWGSSPHGPTIFFNKLATLTAFSKAPKSSIYSLRLRPRPEFRGENRIHRYRFSRGLCLAVADNI